jgi:hypothetical protein
MIYVCSLSETKEGKYIAFVSWSREKSRYYVNEKLHPMGESL